MTAPQGNVEDRDSTIVPGTVFTERQVRLLKIVVIALGVLLVGGFLFVIGTIAYQASKLGSDPQAVSAGEGGPAALSEAGDVLELAVPRGAKVVATSLDGDRLAIHFATRAGPEIVVVDVRRRTVLARVRPKAE
jgi:hypothetical protein